MQMTSDRPRLNDSMRQAFLDRAFRAKFDLQAAEAAPALFSPAWTARAHLEYGEAMRQYEATPA